jgi:hypothetical protein
MIAELRDFVIASTRICSQVSFHAKTAKEKKKTQSRFQRRPQIKKRILDAPSIIVVVSSKSDITKSDIGHYLLLPLVSLSRSNNKLKRSVLDKGFWLIPLPDGIIYDTFSPNTLYLRPAPSVKYLRFPFNLSS